MKDRETDALLAAWAETIARRGPEGAVFNTRAEVSRTFSEIDVEAEQVGRTLDFEPASVLAIQIGNHPAWPATLLACLRRQLVVLPLETSMTAQEREAALGVCHAAGLVTADCAGEVEMIRMTGLRVEWGRNPPSLLKLTSGTTAAPRAIRFRSEQLLADCNQICDTMGITDGDLNFGVIPISHSYGFSNLLTPLLTRGVPLILSHDKMPRAVLDDLACTKATVFPGMPVFYQAFCGMERSPRCQICVSVFPRARRCRCQSRRNSEKNFSNRSTHSTDRQSVAVSVTTARRRSATKVLWENRCRTCVWKSSKQKHR